MAANAQVVGQGIQHNRLFLLSCLSLIVTAMTFAGTIVIDPVSLAESTAVVFTLVFISFTIIFFKSVVKKPNH